MAYRVYPVGAASEVLRAMEPPEFEALREFLLLDLVAEDSGITLQINPPGLGPCWAAALPGYVAVYREVTEAEEEERDDVERPAFWLFDLVAAAGP
jgi:hypothetical protein